MHPTQFGFRANHSTDTECCCFTERIKGNIDKGGVVGAVLLDLWKLLTLGTTQYSSPS